MSDAIRYATLPTNDLWPDFVREVEAIANRPEHGYRALLIVGMRVTDGVVRLNGGASPPALRQPDGQQLTRSQLQAWRSAMLSAATDAVDRVVDAIVTAQEARERNELN